MYGGPEVVEDELVLVGCGHLELAGGAGLLLESAVLELWVGDAERVRLLASFGLLVYEA